MRFSPSGFLFQFPIALILALLATNSLANNPTAADKKTASPTTDNSIATPSNAPSQSNGSTQAPLATDSLAVEERQPNQAVQINQLIDGNLDISLEPQSLFAVPLSDQTAILIEATRLRSILLATEQFIQSEEKYKSKNYLPNITHPMSSLMNYAAHSNRFRLNNGRGA